MMPMQLVFKNAGIIAAALLAVLLAFWLMQSVAVLIVPTAAAVVAALILHLARIGDWKVLILLCYTLPVGTLLGIQLRMSDTTLGEYAGLFEGGIVLLLILLVAGLFMPLAASLFTFAALRGFKASEH